MGLHSLGKGKNRGQGAKFMLLAAGISVGFVEFGVCEF